MTRSCTRTSPQLEGIEVYERTEQATRANQPTVGMFLSCFSCICLTSKQAETIFQTRFSSAEDDCSVDASASLNVDIEQLIWPFPSFEALFRFLLDFLHPARCRMALTEEKELSSISRFSLLSNNSSLLSLLTLLDSNSRQGFVHSHERQKHQTGIVWFS